MYHLERRKYRVNERIVVASLTRTVLRNRLELLTSTLFPRLRMNAELAAEEDHPEHTEYGDSTNHDDLIPIVSLVTVRQDRNKHTTPCYFIITIDYYLEDGD